MENDLSITDGIARANGAVRAAEVKYGREPGSVKLLAVSKTMPASAVTEALAAGQTAFGESYVQEARQKIAELGHDRVEWHFIGPMQSNKTRRVASLFSWVHGVDREVIARRLSGQRPAELPLLNVCVQVNISAEPSKSGVAPGELAEILETTAALPGLHLRGLMMMPGRESDVGRQRRVFAEARRIFDAHSGVYALDTLSMGMSGDFEAAIAEGATMIRLGTLIFGARRSRRVKSGI